VDPYSAALIAAVEQTVPRWVVAGVERRMRESRGRGLDPLEREKATMAGEDAKRQVVAELASLLETDIDDQRETPLTLIRRAVRFPGDVLARLGVPPVERDEFARRSFPSDTYDLSPATWSDIDPALQEPGLEWGAWKAHQHLSRHRPRSAQDAREADD